MQSYKKNDLPKPLNYQNYMVIALIGNIYQIEKSKHVEAIINHLLCLDNKIIAEKQFWNFIKQHISLDTTNISSFIDTQFSADLCISIGGDGTFLKAAALVEGKNIPILGINTGHLGFLAEITPNEFKNYIQTIYDNKFCIEKRSVIEVNKSKGSTALPYALNEVAVLKHDNSSLIHIEAYVDGVLLNNFAADGLIITTPTGSTGYSLSVGGPILAPISKTLCITPIASHSLNTRPIVVPDDVEIILKVESRTNNYLLSIDGRSESISTSTDIHVSKAAHKISVVRFNNNSFYDTLKKKLSWGKRGE